MILGGAFDSEKLLDSCLLEPWELRVRDCKLFDAKQQPKPMS